MDVRLPPALLCLPPSLPPPCTQQARTNLGQGGAGFGLHGADDRVHLARQLLTQKGEGEAPNVAARRAGAGTRGDSTHPLTAATRQPRRGWRLQRAIPHLAAACLPHPAALHPQNLTCRRRCSPPAGRGSPPLAPAARVLPRQSQSAGQPTCGTVASQTTPVSGVSVGQAGKHSPS